ncbi:hypothetical protein ABPG77_004412 [Micractinium sp. CCAP 211/92]
MERGPLFGGSKANCASAPSGDGRTARGSSHSFKHPTKPAGETPELAAQWAARISNEQAALAAAPAAAGAAAAFEAADDVLAALEKLASCSATLLFDKLVTLVHAFTGALQAHGMGSPEDQELSGRFTLISVPLSDDTRIDVGCTLLDWLSGTVPRVVMSRGAAEYLRERDAAAAAAALGGVTSGSSHSSSEEEASSSSEGEGESASSSEEEAASSSEGEGESAGSGEEEGEGEEEEEEAAGSSSEEEGAAGSSCSSSKEEHGLASQPADPPMTMREIVRTFSFSPPGGWILPPEDEEP